MRLTNNVSYAMLSQVSLLGVNFVGFLMLLKRTDLDVFGSWIIFVTIASIIDTLRQGLLHHFMIKTVIRREEEERTLIGKFLWVNLTAVVGASLLVMALLPLWQILLPFPGLQELMRLMLFMTAAQSFIQFLNSYFTAKKNFKQQFLVTAVYSSAFAISLGVLWMTNLLELKFYVLSQFGLASAVLVYHLIAKKWRLVWPGKQWLRELFAYGKFTSGTNLLSLFFHKADVFLIGFFIGPAGTSLYHFASKIIMYCELPLNSISNVLFPKIVETPKEKLPGLYLMAGLGLMLLMAPIVFLSYAFAEFIIDLLGKAEYQPAAEIIRILLLATLFKPWGRVFGLTLDAIGKPNVNFKMLLFSAILNIIMNLLLIPAIGIAGAAIATTISIVITILAGQFLLNKYMGWSRTSMVQPFKIMLSGYLPQLKHIK